MWIKSRASSAIAGIFCFTSLFSARGAAQERTFVFAGDTVGIEAKAFASIVGIWRIEAEGDRRVYSVDGREWKQGQTAPALAEKARALYGEMQGEFIDRVQAFAAYPYAVLRELPAFR